MFLPVCEPAAQGLAPVGLVLQVDLSQRALRLWRRGYVALELPMAEVVSVVESHTLASAHDGEARGAHLCILLRSRVPLMLLADSDAHCTATCALIRAAVAGEPEASHERLFHAGELRVEGSILWSRSWLVLVSSRLYIFVSESARTPTHVYWLDSVRLVQPELESFILELRPGSRRPFRDGHPYAQHGAHVGSGGALAGEDDEAGEAPLHRFAASSMVRRSARVLQRPTAPRACARTRTRAMPLPSF